MKTMKQLKSGGADTDLNRPGNRSVKVKCGDGYLRWREAPPFDAIIVTCVLDHVPPPLIEQLKCAGSMNIPVGGSADQHLHLLEKRGQGIRRRAVPTVRFVSMAGKKVTKRSGNDNRITQPLAHSFFGFFCFPG